MSWYEKLSQLDLAVFFLIVLISIGFMLWKRFSQRKGDSLLEYMLMGRALTLPMFVTSLVATWYSGIFGVTQISFEHGIYNFVTQGVFWYAAALFFALFIVGKARKSAALSLSEYITHMHGKRTGYLTAGLILFKTLPIPYAMAISFFISGFFGIRENEAMLIGMGLATLYCLKGGMRATVISDILQFFAMFMAMGMVVFISIFTFGGWDYLSEKLPASHFSLQGNHSIETVIVWLLVAISTTLLSPVFYQKCFAASSVKTAKVGIFISIGFWIICDIMTTSAGLYARAAMPEAEPSTAFMHYAVEVLPDGFKGFFMASMLITVFSAIDSYLFICSSIITYDLFKKLSHNKASRSWCILLTALLTILASRFFDGKIEQAWLLTESFFMASMLLPIIIGNIMPQKIPEEKICISIVATIIAMSAWIAFGGQAIMEPFFLGFIINAIFIGSFMVLFQVKNLT